MSISVGEYVMRRMQEWGVERLYGYPGDGINGILAGLRKNGDKPRFIQARHEELAAFMACAHAKFTGTVGVCLATSGPGRFICSTVCTMQRWTTNRLSPSPGNPRRPPSAANTSRKWIFSHCSRMWPANTA
jgi:hypothetical protein